MPNKPTRQTNVIPSEVLQALRLVTDAEQRIADDTVRDLILPSGKRFGDCTAKERREFIKWMKAVADRLDSPQ